MLRKIISVLITAAAAISLCGCSADYSSLEGYNEIENARKLYSELYSAHLTVTDAENDMLTQELTFMYDSANVMQYSYFGTDGSKTYYEYHNGTEYSYSDGGEWTVLKEGDENYRSYSRAAKMSMCDEGMIFIKPESVTASKKIKDGDNTVITMQYDAEQLNSSMSSQLGLVGSLKSFEVIYTLDSNGYCIKMEQIGTAQQDMTESKVDYIMQIDKMNDIGVIEKPEKAD